MPIKQSFKSIKPSYLKRQISKTNILKPRTFLKVILGTVAACVLTFGIVLVIIIQPYQSSLDIRQQAATTGLDCNQLCNNSADCAINLRCYNIGTESRCRLALNPISSTCQEIVADFNSDDIDNEIYQTTKGGLNPNDPMLNPEIESHIEPSPTLSTPIDENINQDNNYSDTLEPTLEPVIEDQVNLIGTEDTNQTSFTAQLQSWWQKFNAPEQSNTRRMLIVVLSVGLILLGLALILSSREKNYNKKFNHQPEDEKEELTSNSDSTLPQLNSSQISPASSKNRLAKVSTISSVTNPSSKNQPKSDSSTPPPSILSTAKISEIELTPPKHPNTNQPVPTAVSSAQLYPSGGMTARLKQKGVTPPK